MCIIGRYWHWKMLRLGWNFHHRLIKVRRLRICYYFFDWDKGLDHAHFFSSKIKMVRSSWNFHQRFVFGCRFQKLWRHQLVFGDQSVKRVSKRQTYEIDALVPNLLRRNVRGTQKWEKVRDLRDNLSERPKVRDQNERPENTCYLSRIWLANAGQPL